MYFKIFPNDSQCSGRTLNICMRLEMQIKQDVFYPSFHCLSRNALTWCLTWWNDTQVKASAFPAPKQELHGRQPSPDPAPGGESPGWGHQAAGAGQALHRQHRGPDEAHHRKLQDSSAAPNRQCSCPGETSGRYDGEVLHAGAGPDQSPAAPPVELVCQQVPSLVSVCLTPLMGSRLRLNDIIKGVLKGTALLLLLLLFLSCVFFTLASNNWTLNNWKHLRKVKGQRHKNGNESCLSRAWTGVAHWAVRVDISVGPCPPPSLQVIASPSFMAQQSEI